MFCVASQEIICNSGRQQTKSLTKIPNQNALEFLASGKDFVMDRLTARKDDTKLVGIFRNSKLFVQSVKKQKCLKIRHLFINVP